MEFKDIIKKAEEIQDAYNKLNAEKNQTKWGASEYVQGLVGDVGDLTKLVMAKNNLRSGENVDEKLKHEISDCLWAIIIISKELHIDLEKEFITTMDSLKQRIETEGH